VKSALGLLAPSLSLFLSTTFCQPPSSVVRKEEAKEGGKKGRKKKKGKSGED